MKLRKIILATSIALCAVMALIIGINLNKGDKSYTVIGDNNAPLQSSSVHMFEPGEVTIKKGGSVLEYSYSPSVDSKSTKAIAYEYLFTNTMPREVAINLKEIDTTDVNVTYAWSNSQLDTDQAITSYENFELQRLSSKGDKLYAYILVTPKSAEVPSTFLSSIVWYYGIPQTISVVNTATNTKETKTIVNGQELDVLYEDVVVPNGYYFDSWFKDEECTKPITNNVGNAEATLHVRLANLPSDWLKLVYGKYNVSAGNSTLPENVVVPSYYNGKPVVEVDYQAFDGNTTIKTIDLPSTIKTFDNQCFRNCTQLTSIVMPKSLEKVGSAIFNGCTSLKEVIFPDTVTTFDTAGYQFYNCSSLTKVKLPKNITIIPAYSFYGCTNLAELNIPKGITAINIRAFSLGNSLGKLDLSNCKSLTIINNYAAFESSGITEIDLTGCIGLTNIGDYAFGKCTGLLNVVGLNTCVNLSTMGKSIFNECKSLRSVGEMNKLTKLTIFAQSTFYNCSSLAGKIVLPPNIAEIGANVFYGCASINEVVMPNSVTTIGALLFWNCTSMTNVNLSNKITQILDGTFAGTKISTIDIPTGVTIIGTRAFQACSSLTSVDLSKCTNITSIGARAFYNCKLLTTIGDLGKFTNLTTIPKEAFYYCEKLTTIGDLSKLTKLESIGEQAFLDCRALSGDCVIPASVTKIGQRAFRRAGYTTITFTNTSGWWVTTNTDYTGGTELTSADLVANSTKHLKETYYTYYWRNE